MPEGPVHVVGAFGNMAGDVDGFVEVAVPLIMISEKRGAIFFKPMIRYSQALTTRVDRSRIIACAKASPGLQSSFMDIVQTVLKSKDLCQEDVDFRNVTEEIATQTLN
jgi:hypothetical protein